MDKCIECGFCEPKCPSRGLTLSPRQRITGWRAIAWRVLAGEAAPLVAAGAAVGHALFHLPGKRALAAAFGGFVAALATLRLLRPPGPPLPRPWRLAVLGAGGVAARIGSRSIA